MDKLSVGQTLFAVYARRGAEPRDVTVTKVGRKWAELSDRHRISVNTLYMDGGGYSSPGRCYLDRAGWEAEKAHSDAWRRLRDAVGYQPSKHVTPEEIDEIISRIKGK